MMLSMILCIVLASTGSVNIDVWVDKDDGVYYHTENLRVFFTVDEDCYVAVYNIEVGGGVNQLFPLETDDGWVRAGIVYELPPPDADYEYVIYGEPGIETIIAAASTQRLPGLDEEAPDITREIMEISVQEPEPATLRFITTPEDCRIYIYSVEDDEEESLGTAPRTLAVRPGEYIVTIKRSGYRTLTRKIWLEPGERRRVFVKLNAY
jgi:hypothetical protein